MTKWQTSTPCDLICRLRNSSLFPLGSEVSNILDKKTTHNSHLFRWRHFQCYFIQKSWKIVTRRKCFQQEASGAVSFQCHQLDVPQPGLENITIFSKISKISRYFWYFDIYRIFSIFMIFSKKINFCRYESGEEHNVVNCQLDVVRSANAFTCSVW
jgi:hypothetical protein